MITVVVNGYKGKVGQEIIRAFATSNEVRIVGKSDFDDSLESTIKSSNPQVVIDFTHPDSVFKNAVTILKNGCNAIIGTTGLTAAQRTEIDQISKSNKVGVVIAPNFSIGAILLMQFAAQATKFFPNVEIIEYHHDQKADAPSGTAVATAEYLMKNEVQIASPKIESKEILDGVSRGVNFNNIRIHAVRLPGYVASQEVLIGGQGQRLSIRHDTINREAFIPGILLSVKFIVGKIGLFYGLENIIFSL